MFTTMDLILLTHVDTMQPHSSEEKPTNDVWSRMAKLESILNSNKVLDSKISEEGRVQCQKIAHTLNWNSISLIIVSPLRRCLQTCRELLKLAKMEIQVCVEPLISAKVSNLEALGCSKAQLQADYPQFSFQNLVECKKVPWYLRQLRNDKQKKMACVGSPQKIFENGIQEDDFEFRLRLLRFEKELKNHLEKRKFGSRILIISHEEVFQMITAKFFNEGKSNSDLSFANGELNFVSSCQIFHPLSPSPAL